MSTMLIRESSVEDDSTDDGFGLEQEIIIDVEKHIHTIFNSKNDTDRRLVKAYQTKRWKDDYKRHKGKIAPFRAT